MKKIDIEITLEEIKDLLFKKTGMEGILAGKIYRGFMDRHFNEIKREYIKLTRSIIKDVVSDLIENYYATNNIEGQVRRGIDKMTKDDLIKLLADK